MLSRLVVRPAPCDAGVPNSAGDRERRLAAFTRRPLFSHANVRRANFTSIANTRGCPIVNPSRGPGGAACLCASTTDEPYAATFRAVPGPRLPPAPHRIPEEKFHSCSPPWLATATGRCVAVLVVPPGRAHQIARRVRAGTQTRGQQLIVGDPKGTAAPAAAPAPGRVTLLRLYRRRWQRRSRRAG